MSTGSSKIFTLLFSSEKITNMLNQIAINIKHALRERDKKTLINEDFYNSSHVQSACVSVTDRNVS